MRAEMPDVDAFANATGFLRDSEIKAAIENGFLIVGGTASIDRIRHASYELRLGEAHVAPLSPSKVEAFEFRIRRLSPDQPALRIQPGEIALLYSIEVVSLPPDVLGFTVARGLLYAEGLTPENTYIDPGFAKSIYTTVVNHSNRVISLTYGMPIARLFFYRFSEQVDKSYEPGATKQIQQQIASEISSIVSTPHEASQRSAEGLIEDVRTIPMAGNQIVELIRREQAERRTSNKWTRIWLAVVALYIFVSPIVKDVINASPRLRTALASFGENLAADIVAAIVIGLVPLVAWLARIFRRRNE